MVSCENGDAAKNEAQALARNTVPGSTGSIPICAATPLPSSSLQPVRLIQCVPEAHWGVIEDLVKGEDLMHLATQVEPYRS